MKETKNKKKQVKSARKADLTFQSVPLHKGQYEMVDQIYSETNEFITYWTVNTPRQFGKTTLISQMIVCDAFRCPGAELMYVSPTYALAKKMYKLILNGLEDLKVIKSQDASDYIIELQNGSVIMFKSVAQPENLRGNSVSHMYCDEAALYKEDVFTAILKPMLTVRGKKCYLFSTPRGKTNWFYKYYKWGSDPHMSRYGCLRGVYTDNAFANLEEIEDARKSLPTDLFNQEYLGEFIDDSGSVFRNITKCETINSWARPQDVTERCYAALDVAATGDWMVLTVMGESGRVLAVYRDTRKPLPLMIKNVGDMLQKYRPVVTLMETNGIGKGLYDQVRKFHASVREFTTTNETKQDMISDLIMSFEDEEIQIPSPKLMPELHDELCDFGFTWTPKTRKIAYHALTGHDDTVMSLALADHCRRNFKNAGKYVIL